MDQQYLSSTHSPIINPLCKSMRIKLYTEKWLRLPGMEIQPHLDIVDTQLSDLYTRMLLPHPDTFVKLAEFSQETSTVTVYPCMLYPLPKQTTQTNSFMMTLLQSGDNMFFIQYTPESTMERWRYLVKVDLEASDQLDINYTSSGSVYCCFLVNKPSNTSKSDA